MIFILTAGVLALPIAASTAAAPDAPTADAPEVREIVVTATRERRALNDVPDSVSVVGAREIALTPAQSLDDVLRRTPSVDVPISPSSQTHPTADNVSIRGLGGIRALVLLDGVPLNDPFFGYVQWARATLEAIDRVEVVRGAQAGLWGNYAMGGVISIFTRGAIDNETRLHAGLGGYGTWRQDAFAAMRLGPRLGLSLDAGRNQTDGFQTTPDALRVPVDAPTAFSADHAALTIALTPDDRISAHARVNYFDDAQHLNSRLALNTQRTWTLSGDANVDLGGWGRLQFQGYSDSSLFRTDNTDTPDGVAPGAAEFVQNRHLTPVHDIGGSIVWTRDFAGGLIRDVSLGADAHVIAGADYARIYADPGGYQRTDIGRGRQRFVGLFAQTSLKPTDALEVLVSARWQRFANYDAYDGSPGGLGATPDRSAASVDPRVSARWRVSRTVALRAAAYSAFRAPTLDNLYRAFATPQGVFYGNAALKPETLTGAEAGFDVDQGAVRLQVTAFTNTLRNLITPRPLAFAELPPGFFYGSRLINAGAARSQGVEAEVEAPLGEHLELRAGYTFADSVITANPEDPASVGRQQGGVPRQRATVGLTWRDGRLTLAPQARWVSKSWGDNDGAFPVDAHLVADLAAAWKLTPRSDAIVQVQNLFDRRYVADNNGYEAPRIGTPLTAFAGIRLRFGA